jgi:glycosyltransferase 2 family protein
MKSILFGITISLAFIGFLVYKFDYREFLELWSKVDYFFLIPAFFFQILGTVFFSVRWYYLLERKLNLKHSISSSFIGYGANMVLPARGGDLFRIYYCRSETNLRSLSLLSKLFLEKVIDFLSVILIGVFSFAILKAGKISGPGSFAVFTVSGVVVLGMIITLYLIRFQSGIILTLLGSLAKWIKKEDFFKNQIEAHILDMKDFLKIENFLLPAFYTGIVWVCYTAAHISTASMLGIELGLLELGFILFCGAISLAVPSAPSGVGVYHGSIISAFILLGRESKQGLVFATAQHLMSFVVLSVLGLLFYLYWTYRRRHGKQKGLSTHLEEEQKSA